jgi:chitobiase/beta-hexosaminidase-like protein/parallel beta helix pectate lyase-like protein
MKSLLSLPFLLALANLIPAPATCSTRDEQVPMADFYVSPDGNDSWSGHLPGPNATSNDGPLATLDRARRAVRTARKTEPRDFKVLIRGGTYRLTETVVFSLDDSAGEHTTTYAALPGEAPVFSSGVPISNWQRLSSTPPNLPQAAHGNVWVADVSRLRSFKTLYDGNLPLPRARGFAFSPQNSTPRGSQDYNTTEFPEGAVSVCANLADAELRIVPSHFWVMNLLPIESIDESTNTIRTAQPGTYPLGRNGMADRDNAWIENALEVLDEPREWVLDTSNSRLYFWPPEGTPSDDIVAPTLTELIRVEGQIDYEGPTDTPVEGLAFQGLTFTHGDRCPWHGRTGWGLQHDWECFDKPTALLRFRGAQRCAVEDCQFMNSGHTAIRMDLHCQDIRVVGNHIHHIGGVGVLMAGYGPGTKDVNRNNVVANNLIHHIGLEYWGSVAIFAWQSGENQIAHNHIHHIPYTAILSTGRINRTPPGPAECSRTVRWNETSEAFRGWPWKQREPYLHSRNNSIEFNDIHNAMEVLGDGNCIYVSGAGGGTIVRHNFCHDCTGRYMNAVIRCDDDQHDTLMEGNICCRTGGYGEGFISKGDNDIVSNVIADLRPLQRHRGYIVFPYGNITGARIEGNVLYSRHEGQILYHHSQTSSRGTPRLVDAQVDNNLYFCTEDEHWADDHLKQQREKGNEAHSRQADPQFVDIDRDDFGFPADSPAAALGIRPLDTLQTGLEPEYRQRLLGRPIRTNIQPPGQMLRRPLTISITCSDPQAKIRYTLDGTEPSPASPLYAGPFKLSQAATVCAKAFATGAADLIGATVLYTPPPAPILEDFESLPVGATTPEATTTEDAELKQYTARVTDQNAAGSRRSLRFTDGPGQKASYTPHVYYRRTYQEGTMAGSFDVFVDAQAEVSYQWRQYEKDYITGPQILIEPGGRVTHQDKLLTIIPAGQWIRFELRSKLGDGANGRFDLAVTPTNASPQQFNALPCDPHFQRLDWIGFVSRSKNASIHHIDNIRVHPQR